MDQQLLENLKLLFNDPDLTRAMFGESFFFADLKHNFGISSNLMKQLGFSEEELRNENYKTKIHPEDLENFNALGIVLKKDGNRKSIVSTELRIVMELGFG